MKKLLRVILGVMLLAIGANKFFAFMPMFELSPSGTQFMQALGETGYMIPMIGFVEIICGLLFLKNSTAPLATLLLAPLSVNIIAFHVFLAPESIFLGFIVFATNVILGVMYFDHYRPIFAEIFAERVVITRKETTTARPAVVVNN